MCFARLIDRRNLVAGGCALRGMEDRAHCVGGREVVFLFWYIQSETKKERELLKNPTKIEEIQEKKFIDRN